MTPPQFIIPFLISFLIMTTLALFAGQRRAGAGHHFGFWHWMHFYLS